MSAQLFAARYFGYFTYSYGGASTAAVGEGRTR